MADKETLPGPLQYLQPFRKFLAKLPQADFGDATDTTLLENLVHVQIRGKTVKEAQERLSADLEELEKYLSEPRRRNDRLHFVVGFLLIAAENPESLLEPPEKPKPVEQRLIMDLPPKAKVECDQYSLILKWKRQYFNALVRNMDDDFSRKMYLTQFANPNANEYERFILMGEPALAERIAPSAREIHPQSNSVNLGKVIGHKYISLGKPPATWKIVDYLLQIPGCYVSASIKAPMLFDESQWEPYLATLRFEKTT